MATEVRVSLTLKFYSYICRARKACARPCMIKINKLLKDQVSFNRLLGGRPDLRTGY